MTPIPMRCPARPPSAAWLFLLLPLLLGWPGAPAAQEGDRTLHWRELSVQARLDGDGLLHVRERQAMVFDGDWNGGERTFDVRLGQTLTVHGIDRIDPATGARTPLRAGDLDVTDGFARDGSTVRWRSRLPSDPPFRNQEIVYEIAYTLGPVVTTAEGGAYSLRHDFAFADRAGVIERFRVALTLDSAWRTPLGADIVEEAVGLAPGRGYVVALPLRHAAPGVPAAVATGAPASIRVAAALGALLVPLLVLLALRRGERELERVAPLTPPDHIDEAWLRANIFAYPAELVGAAWDRAVGGAEVAALLARLVAEGKLTSRVEESRSQPVLHLRRVAPASAFAPHERALLDGLFFDGGDQTDTEAVRKHYEDKGFAPASLISGELKKQLETLPGRGRVGRRWAPAAAVMLAGAALSLGEVGRAGGAPVAVIGLVIAALAAAIVLGSAATLAQRVTYRTGPRAGVLVPLAVASALLALLAAGVFEGEGGFAFFRPGPLLLVGHLVLLAGIGWLATTIARSTETRERLAFRRRLVCARDFLRAELARPEPRLEDAWFPYLLAFGLGPHVDRWFRDFGGTRAAGIAGMAGPAAAMGAGGGAGSGSGGWSGGGPQFGGGGGFGGGGVSGSWSVAAAGMATSVAAPGSGGGGGGGSSSGGGGGGGW